MPSRVFTESKISLAPCRIIQAEFLRRPRKGRGLADQNGCNNRLLAAEEILDPVHP
jgi:hypothetical protein